MGSEIVAEMSTEKIFNCIQRKDNQYKKKNDI